MLLRFRMLFSLLLSDKTSILEKEHEWTSLHRGRVLQGLLSEPTEFPELKPFEVVRALLDIILIPVMLEEEHLITPKG